MLLTRKGVGVVEIVMIVGVNKWKMENGTFPVQ